MKQRRNGEIELMRFLFAVGIVVFHFDGRYSDAGFFRCGYIAVEFFFVLSGYLMSRSARKALDRGEGIDIPGSTWKFIFRKFKTFYRYYLFAILAQIVIKDILVGHEVFSAVIRSIFRSAPTLTLTFYLLSWPDVSLYIGSTWFLSTMIICMFVLYPMILKNFDLAVKITMPIIFVFAAGYVLHRYNNSMHNVKVWNDLFYSGVPKSFAEIAFGACLYFIPEKIDKVRNEVFASQKLADLLFTLLKWGSVLIVFLYSLGVFRKVYDLECILLSGVFVTISFSNAGYHLRGSRFTDLLGQLSLPLFIFHKVILNTLMEIKPCKPYPNGKYLVLILLTLITCVVMKLVTDFVWKWAGRLLSGKVFKKPQES